MVNRRGITGHIRERYGKDGSITSYQVVLYRGKKPNGKNNELFFKAKTQEEAEELLERKKAEFVLGELQEPSVMTVNYYLQQEWFPNYVEQVLKPTSVRAYLSHMRYIEESIGNVKLQQLSTTQVQRMYVSLMQKSPLSGNPLSYRTVLDIHRTLTSALNVAQQAGYIKRNPTVGTKLRRPSVVTETKKMVYDSQEVHKLLEGVKGTDMEMPLTLIIDATLRRGEALCIEWSDVDFEKGTIRIDKNWVEDKNNQAVISTPKSRASVRVIKITDKTLKLLKKAKADYNIRKLANKDFIDSQRVICQKNGKPYAPKSFYKKYKKVIRKLQLPDIRLHDLRHTGITLQLENGANIKAVSTRAGHSDIQVTGNIYAHCTQKMENETVDILEKVLGTVINE